MKYLNPIIPGFNPDPSICCVDKDYYLVTSSFEFFPGVPIFHSRDLINWEQIGHCLTRKSQLNLDKASPSGGIYAPTIRYHKGTFYMVTTNVSNKGNFYVTASDPAGEWSEPIWVEQKGIDPSLLFDDDGKVYFASNAGAEGKPGIALSEIDIATGQLISPMRHLWEGTGGRYPEAPHLYKINGIYYLLIAEGGTEYGHMVTIARSNSPWGPFEPCPSNPILTHRNKGNSEIQGTGHGDLIQAHDGSWWMVFLAFRISRSFFHHLGRETFLSPVTWNSDGWPVINKNGTVDAEMEAACLPQYLFMPQPIRDDFDQSELSLSWNFLRNPYPNTWDLDSRKGWLCLTGNDYSLNDIDSPAFIGRRQQHFNCKSAVKLDFAQLNENGEAGLTVFYNFAHHYEIAVTKLNGTNQVIVRRRIGDLTAIVAQEIVTEEQIILVIKADRHDYSFGFGYDETSINFVCKGKTYYLSPEAAGSSFTGVYMALYASGNGSQAYFDWFEYEEI